MPCPMKRFFGKWDSDTNAWKTEGKINYQFSAELTPVEEAVKKGDYKTAEEELLNYYQERKGFKTLENYETGRRTEVADLLLDWILTLSGESYATTVTVGNKYELVQADVTRELKGAAGENISFILMARHKGPQAMFHSREHNEHPPMLEVTIDDKTHTLTAVKDTYIHAGQPDSNFGSEEVLFVKDEGSPYNEESSKSYLQFDLSELQGEVSDATLHLYGANTSKSDDFQVMIYLTNNTGWNEDELTWSNHFGKTFSWEGIEGGTDWRRPPASDPEFFYQIPRFNYASTLIVEYKATGDRTYTDHLVMMMMDFIYDTEAYGGLQGAGSYPRTIDSAIRAFNWINAYHFLKDTESLSASANTAIVKTLWKTAKFLESEFNDSNWGVIESKAFTISPVIFQSLSNLLRGKR